MKVLIAEDNITSRSMLSAVLEKAGHDVVPTCDGAEAWAAMKESDAPRLAILDWMMPEMDGIEVCQRIRSLETHSPAYIIMLTSLGEKERMIQGLNSGADDYLVKPFDLEELNARINVGCRVIEMQNRLVKHAEELRRALDQIETLKGIIPICANCKEIRDDKGYWHQVETYVSAHSEAKFSHGICPKCAEELYPEIIQQERD